MTTLADIVRDGLTSSDRPVYVLAEAACEHRHSMVSARRLIEAAKAAGADGIKFQLHVPDAEMIGDHPKMKFWAGRMIDVLREVNFETVEEHRQLKQMCDEVGIEYHCTPFCIEAADRLDEVGVDLFKIGSGELTNLPMLKHIALKGKPMIVSTGMSQWDEIDESVELLNAIGVPYMLMNCTSEYPTPPEHANVGLVPVLRERYGVLVGQSDHTTDIYSSIAAVVKGASVIEKHFTLRDLHGPDDLVSLDPERFKELVNGIRQVEVAAGNQKMLYSGELATRDWAHHSITTVMAIPAGTTITESMVALKRPSGGLPASELQRVIGAKAARDLNADTQISFDEILVTEVVKMQ